MRPPFWAIEEELEALSGHFPAGIDPYGTLYAILEGGPGGHTVLVWAPWAAGPEAMRAILSQPFAGRVILGLDVSGGDATPLAALTKRFSPRATLIVDEGEGLAHRFPGGKEIEAEEGPVLVPLDDPRPPRRLRRLAPTGLVYEELRLFQPWESPALNGAQPRPGSPLGAISQAAGSLAYSAGLKALTPALAALHEGLGD